MKNFCLVTGPNVKDWPENCKLKLLGDFCINDLNNEKAKDWDYTSIKPYGDTPSIRRKDKIYTENFYERLLISISNFLNSKHDLDYSIRYWRILIGPWLNTLVPILYNRWKKINVAIEEDFDLIATTMSSKKNIIPYDTEDFMFFHLKSEWNSDLFSRILEFRQIHCDINNIEENHIKHLELGKSNLRSKTKNIIQFLTSKDNNYFIITPYIERKSAAILQIMLKQFPVFYQSKKPTHIMPDVAFRNSIVFDFSKKNEFEEFTSYYLKYAIPTIFLEGFSSLSSLVNSMPWPHNPKAIFTSNSFFTDEVFKKWAADKILKGIPYFIGQHGGGYGIKEFPQRTELHEQKSADYWLSWGSNFGQNESVLSTTNFKLIGSKVQKNSMKNSLLLQITDDLFPYSRFPWCSDEYNKIYMDEQVKFASLLGHEVQKNLLVRLHSNQAEYGVDQNYIWSSKAPNINIDQGFHPIKNLIRKSRIVVSTYNATSFLETLSLNIPTVIFWNLEKSPVSSQAKPFFNLLSDCSIFHNTPESAAKHISSVWNNVHDWWDEDQVQEARQLFCENFSQNNEQPLSVIHNIISKKKY